MGQQEFLPISKRDMQAKGWQQADFICVTGDSYVDHPSFGVAIISRLLESMGFAVCVLPQPLTDADFTRFGPPRLGFMVTSGNIDSMVNNYTAARRRRSGDVYTAGGKAGKRPDYCLAAYCQSLKRLYPQSPVIAGGLEASFRRFAHYDYWADAVHPSVLVQSGADLLCYGMGERATRQIAADLAAGQGIRALTGIRGTCFMGGEEHIPENAVRCASFARVSADKAAFARAYKAQLDEQDHITGRPVVQKHGEDYLIQNPPMAPLSESELDATFALPFTRAPHPSYQALGGVKAIEEVENSIMYNRGCFGGCNFCSIAFHQGRSVVSRSKQSVLDEARRITEGPNFKGFIHDVGGPTANFSAPSCKKQVQQGMCRNRKCLAPTPCPALEVSHEKYLDILRGLRGLPGVKKVFVRSGLRFDYMNLERDKSFIQELVRYHISGQLKVAPEHCAPAVLDLMGKPHIKAFDQFAADFYKATRQAGKEQYLVPYLMSSHPGSTLRDAVMLALYLKKNRLRPQQVQDFYPTPGTASTAMFYTGLDPFTMKPVYVARDPEEKAMQRALLQYYEPANHPLVRKALRKTGRADLIGFGPQCLVPPDKNAPAQRAGQGSGARPAKPGRRGRQKPPRPKGRA